MANKTQGASKKRTTRRPAAKRAAPKSAATPTNSTEPPSPDEEVETNVASAQPDPLDLLDDLIEMADGEDNFDEPDQSDEFRAYMRAAAANYFARQKTGGKRVKPSRSSKRRRNQSMEEDYYPSNMAGGGEYLDMLSDILGSMGGGDVYPGQVDDMSSGVSMILGSGPAIASLNAMMTNSSAQGSVLMNATQMQRQLDQVGLVCTSACVKQLLSMNDHGGDTE